MKKFLILLLTFTNLILNCVGIEPISTTIAIAASAGAYIGKDYLCSFNKWLCVTESCAEYYIPADVEGLNQNLYRNIFGQHIVIRLVTGALRVHFDHSKRSTKPLVMSFHGTPGTGKNYVAEHIAKTLYRKGLKSNYVHRYSGRIDFTEKAKTEEYSTQLRNDIVGAIKNCPRSLFIFDEVDSMPPGVFDTITYFLDHHENINKLDFRQAVFIFLSNVGGWEISEKLLEVYRKKGLVRENVDMNSFEKLLEVIVYNNKGGLQASTSIKAGLIDHFIPFLPLEKRHVEKCIEVEGTRLGLAVTNDFKKYMFSHVTFQNDTFSAMGCKRLAKKADIYADPNTHAEH